MYWSHAAGQEAVVLVYSDPCVGFEFCGNGCCAAFTVCGGKEIWFPYPLLAVFAEHRPCACEYVSLIMQCRSWPCSMCFASVACFCGGEPEYVVRDSVSVTPWVVREEVGGCVRHALVGVRGPAIPFTDCWCGHVQELILVWYRDVRREYCAHLFYFGK